MFDYDRLALDVAEQFTQIRSTAITSSAMHTFDPFVNLVSFSSILNNYIVFICSTFA